MDKKDLISKSETLKKFIKDNKKIFSCGLITCEDDQMLKELTTYFAMAIMCKESFPCQQCSNCQKIKTNNAIEVFSYPKFKKEISVEDIEEVISSIIKRPLDFDKKIYIFNRIDNASISAQNKLLKCMEEFPDYCIMIFTAINSKQVLPTILSRVTLLNVPAVALEEYENILSNYVEKNSLPISTIYELASGQLFVGLDMLYNEKIKEIFNNCIDILKNINNQNIIKYSSIITKTNLKDYLKIFSAIISKMISNKAKISNEYELVTKNYTIKSLLNIADLIQYSNRKLKANTNDQSIIDNLLIGIMEEKI